MTLQTYRKMRDFGNTPEPGGKAGSGAGNAFVIQKHDARRLHYDLRLQIGGALASWAVTRGPSLIAADKRLAVRVEDHPLDYGDFEGTIPAGNYGIAARGRQRAIPSRGWKRGIWNFPSAAKSWRGAGIWCGWPASRARSVKTGF